MEEVLYLNFRTNSYVLIYENTSISFHNNTARWGELSLGLITQAFYLMDVWKLSCNNRAVNDSQRAIDSRRNLILMFWSKHVLHMPPHERLVP